MARPSGSILDSYGPVILVTMVASAVLLAGPAVVSRLTEAHTDAKVAGARGRLDEDPILARFSQATRDLATIVEPSVVHISTRADLRDPKTGRTVPMSSSGSGWVYDADGHIVTNAHVVDGAKEIEVQFHNGSLRKVTSVKLDLRTDIAVLKIEHGGLRPAERGRSELIHQGDLVFAFGSPFDFRFSMSSGIVSGLGRSAGLSDVDFENFIQVDAAINPGNSGGPLTDITGRVVGMNTAIATGRGNTTGVQGQSAGIGLAIPMSIIESVVPQLIEKGEVDKGFMGVRLSLLTDARARTAGYEGHGVMIGDVEAGAPAHRSGLRPGDIITHINGQPINSQRQIPAIVATHRPGQTILVRVWRSGDGTSDRGPDEAAGGPMEIPVVLEKLDPALIAERPVDSLDRFGVRSLQTANRLSAVELSLPQERGVIVIETTPGSSAEASTPRGSLIVAVNDLPVSSVDEFYTRLMRATPQSGIFGPRSSMSTVVILTVILPGGETRNVPIPI